MLRDLFSLFPAYAGVIPEAAADGQGIETFPRIRGGDPALGFDMDEITGFSPHTRG